MVGDQDAGRLTGGTSNQERSGEVGKWWRVGTLPIMVGDQEAGRLTGGTSHPERSGEVVESGHTSQYGGGPG